MTPSPQKSEKSQPASASSASADQTGTPSVVTAPGSEEFDVIAFRETEEGKKLISWATNEFSRCRTEKTKKAQSWYTNLAFYFGHQWLDKISKNAPGGMAGKLRAKVTPPYLQKRTVNRIRSFVRTEQSKFLSTLPVISAVPATSEEEDVRAAYAAEQVWQSYSSKRMLRREYSRATWWKIVTGNGFMKAWWDPSITDKTTGQPGDVMYRSVTPFHIFVPDMREREIDDQPYVIQAQVKPLQWCRQQYPEELKGVDLSPSQSSSNQLMDDGYFNLAETPKSQLDACTILEVWVKPGTTNLLPNGGLLVLVEDVLVGAYVDGMPYRHGEYPYTKIEHLSNDTFWADSPLVDLIELQKEYNDLRTQIGLSARRMGNPQLLAQRGSVVTSRMTNEPGQVIQYQPGTPPPTPLPLQPIPEYVIGQITQVLMDFEDISGQHEISRGQAPTGVEAGTALAFLKETDDAYLTPQYQNIEDAFERLARQTLVLFQEYVDVGRKLRVIGSDGAFDTALLTGADIAGATDIRVEPGSSIGQSQAAKRAAVMEMFAVGILQDPAQALRLLEMGGAQKILDTVSVAEKKAQRENTRIKSLKSAEGMEMLQQHMMENIMQMAQQMVEELNAQIELDPAAAADPMTGVPEMHSVESVMQDPQLMQMMAEQVPPLIPADDFDMHEIHIDVHNRYRMGQEYESLPDPIKQEFDKHVEMHKVLQQQQQMEQLMQMLGGMGDPSMMEEGGAEEAPMPPDNIGPGPAPLPV